MTVDTSARMDELPTLSFTSKYSPKTQMYAQPGTASGSVDRHGAVPKPVYRSGVSCNICGQHFIEEHRLRLHQKVCHTNNLQPNFILATIGDKTEPSVSSYQHHRNAVRRFSGHCTRNQRRLYQAFAQSKARKNVRSLPKWDDSRPVNAFWAVKRPCHAPEEKHPSCLVSQEDFINNIDLISSASAVEIKKRSESEEHEDVSVDCQIESVAGPLCDEPLQSPRTTRSLMSQLSRESADAVRKRLSFSLDSEDQEGSENETLDSAAARRSIQVSLLAIDFSSPLGQRLKKHMKSDLVVPPITDIEQHCMTIPVLDEMAARLRHRANEYPIMHRKRKGIVTGYCHTLKFNRAERLEFLKTLRTGLNARSRKLLKQTKKASVRLTRLRAEVIRYWTVKKRTIVNEEITIDDDLSIVQVEVPEHLFKTVRKMSMPSPQQMHCRGQPVEGRYLASQEAYPRAYHSMAGAGPHQHASHSQQNPHLSYPYSSSSLGASFSGPGPVPQFLVKQVSKNWTENGQESQKLVFVPLDEAGPSQHPNVTVRNMAGGSAQRSYPQCSSGIKKSLPRHLRPCPKSQRKRQQDRDDSSEEFVIETASSSSSSEEEHEGAVRCKPKEAQERCVYPLSLSRAREMVPTSSWGVSDRPVPQMLHIANSASAGVPVSGLLPFPSGMVPVSWEHHMEALSGGSLKSSTLGRGLSAAESVEHHSELRKHLSMYPTGSGAISSFPKPVGEEMEDSRIGVNISRDGIPHHSVAAANVCRTTEYHKPQAAASSSKRVSPVQQPNFLQLPSEPPKLHDSSRQPPQLHYARHQGTAHGTMPRLIRGPPQLPITSSSQSLKQQTTAKSSSIHHPNILRSQGKTQSSAAAAATSGKPVVSKITSKKDGSSSDWKVIRASDDDVVEVICIDDD